MTVGLALLLTIVCLIVATFNVIVVVLKLLGKITISVLKGMLFLFGTCLFLALTVVFATVLYMLII